MQQSGRVQRLAKASTFAVRSRVHERAHSIRDEQGADARLVKEAWMTEMKHCG